MPPAISRSIADTITIRLERKLKDEFISAAKAENRPASEALRDLMLAYVEDQERKRFEAEAPRVEADRCILRRKGSRSIL
jgi:hypothetical protein